jgi:hypothetical protein
VATPRMAAKGPPKGPPFGKLSAHAKKSGPQPPIPATKVAKPSVGKGKPFTKPGTPTPAMKGMGGR